MAQEPDMKSSTSLTLASGRLLLAVVYKITCQELWILPLLFLLSSPSCLPPPLLPFPPSSLLPPSSLPLLSPFLLPMLSLPLSLPPSLSSSLYSSILLLSYLLPTLFHPSYLLLLHLLQGSAYFQFCKCN